MESTYYLPKMNSNCLDCSNLIVGFPHYDKYQKGYICGNCVYRPECDLCSAEDSLIFYGSDNSQRCYCSRCFQKKIVYVVDVFKKK